MLVAIEGLRAREVVTGGVHRGVMNGTHLDGKCRGAQLLPVEERGLGVQRGRARKAPLLLRGAPREFSYFLRELMGLRLWWSTIERPSIGVPSNGR